MEAYAYGIGLVFQIVDDVLDVTSTPEQLGKPLAATVKTEKQRLQRCMAWRAQWLLHSA